MQEIEEKYKDKGVKVLGILADNKLETGKNMLDQKGGKYANILIVKSLEAGFLDQIMYVPTTLIVDSDGGMIGDLIVGSRSAKELSKLIDKALNK